MSWLAVIAAFATCWWTLTWLLRRSRLPMDHPNERSLHATPTPRIGGLGIMAGLLAAAMGLGGAEVLPVVLAAAALAAVSVLDDVRGLSVSVRFLAHFVVAVGCLLASGLSGWVLLVATLAVVWMTNLYNFMDGSDGLAGGMAVIGFGALAVAAWLGDTLGLAAFCASIAAAALAFLRFNFPPARLFMGDSGSIPLGFMAATLGIAGAMNGVWPWLFPLLVFSPFIVDASVTLARRALRGEKIWQAHRSHYYQRAVLLGATHRQLALAAYALMLLAAVLAFALLLLPQYSAGLLILSASMYLLIFLAIEQRWRTRAV
ncbi:MAG: UDP-phosphate N-acetylglucosaminyl 1-phosphate transferase [Thiobacillus sp. SCN 64-35]|uniref:MraY family glycosyltransferase n=1 Tax=Thiobacillus sp. 0-1251 TaxID=1895858 RepID=UPI00086B9FED|nr:glycosyltransferase family 4 protein [Thiobacillus sp. 0-1251]ODU14637.1 MAG: UDP-phosphate N-acetylglucosaminyl 1-phosphate transferase [Thiobacillus sp. SCN 64-35]OJY60343.1 MAG: UDP-phosphate N-acetylglucosaminyl 1-phosphate transferase [Thiobacillus sp. 0-1251]